MSAGNHFVNNAHVVRLVRVSFALRYDSVASTSFADKNDDWPAMTDEGYER